MGSTPNKKDRTYVDDFSSASGTNSNNRRLAYCITSSDNSAWIASGSKYSGHGVRPVYSDSVYKTNPNFIRPSGREYVGCATVFTISSCWNIPFYGDIRSKDSGTINVSVKFDKEGNVTDVSMNGMGPVSKNKETCNAIETEIRNKKMKQSIGRNNTIPSETEAQIRYEFR